MVSFAVLCKQGFFVWLFFVLFFLFLRRTATSLVFPLNLSGCFLSLILQALTPNYSFSLFVNSLTIHPDKIQFLQLTAQASSAFRPSLPPPRPADSPPTFNAQLIPWPFCSVTTQAANKWDGLHTASPWPWMDDPACLDNRQQREGKPRAASSASLVRSELGMKETRAERDEEQMQTQGAKLFLFLQTKTSEMPWPSLLFIQVWSLRYVWVDVCVMMWT